MGRIFITGSADGLGLLAAKELIDQGHEVTLHARSEKRGEHALNEAPGAASVLIADLADIEQTRRLAIQANAQDAFDAVIHNAGVYRSDEQQLLNVNTLSPYMLTALMHRPQRLIYLSSGMHLSGNLQHIERPSYSDTKLHVVMLVKALARKWPGVYANAVDPGWVPTKMGGAGAPDDLQKGYETQVWLAASNDKAALVSGQYFHHKAPARYQQIADNIDLQEQLIARLAALTGVSITGDK